MRRIADLYPGRAKTDARDAFIIADAARSLPHTPRPGDVGDETSAELEVLVGFDDDLAGEATRLSNRIRGLLTGIHPALEHAIGPKITHPAVLEILSRCGGPAGMRLTRVHRGDQVGHLVVRTHCRDAALGKHDDAVGGFDGRGAVRDHQQRALGGDVPERAEEHCLVGGVEVRAGFVHEQQLWSGKQGTGDGDALPLATGEQVAVLPDGGVQTGGQPNGWSTQGAA